MAWQGIEGHDAVLERFIQADERGRVAGSFLFIGPHGVGKGMFALALAKALVCELPRPGLEPCGGCRSCLQSAAGTHPDIDIVRKPEDRATIPIELLIGDAEHRMREGLCWRLLLKPALGGRKVAILLDADHLSEEAANCLLKTLEEPPDNALIILVGTSLERQLPTIRSRCQIVRFRPLATDAVGRILASETGQTELNEASLKMAAAGSGGSLVRARLLLDQEVASFRDRLMGLLATRPLRGVDLARDTIAFIEAAGKDAPPRRARLRIVLESAVEFYRAALQRAVQFDGAGPTIADAAISSALTRWQGDADEAAAAISRTLDALDALERNANLTILIDAWTAIVEQPRLAQSA
jgi:DNA polymerase-3 subunit delta'